MAYSGPWQHPTTGSPGGPLQKSPLQKRPRGRPRKVVDPGTGGSVGGQPVEGNTIKEAAFGFAGGIGVTQGSVGFAGGIGVTQGSVVPYSGVPTYRSQHVPASERETRVSHGVQSEEHKEKTTRKNKSTVQGAQKRHIGVKRKPWGKWGATIFDPSGAKVSLGTFPTEEEAIRAYEEAACRFRSSQENLNTKDEVPQRDGNCHQLQHATGTAGESQHFGAVDPSNRITDTPDNIDLISQHFPGFHLYVQLLRNPGLSELPAIQRSLAMLLPNNSLQQRGSNTALSWPTESIPVVSASASQHPNPTSQVREIAGGMEHNRGLSPLPVVQPHLPIPLPNPSLQQPWPTESVPAISASALQDHVPTEPSNFTALLMGDDFDSQPLYSNLPGPGAQEYLGRLNLLNSRPFSMEQNAGSSARPLFQQSPPNFLPNVPSWQQPTSGTVLSRPTQIVPAFSASALQHPIPTGPSSQSTKTPPGFRGAFESPSLYSNVPGSGVQESCRPRLNQLMSRSFSTKQNRGHSPLPLIQQYPAMSQNPGHSPFPLIQQYPAMSQNPGHSPFPLIQQYPAMSPPNPSLQQLTSPPVSASALQHRIPSLPSNQSYRNVSSVSMVSASALHHPIPTDPSNQPYGNAFSVPTVSATAIQHSTPTDPSNQSYRNPSRRQ